MGADKNVYPAGPDIMESRFHPPADDSVRSTSAAGSQATVTVAAGVGGQRRVVTGFSFSLHTTVGLAAGSIGCFIIDGASAGTTYLWRETMAVTTLGSMPMRISETGLNIVGSENTALTIEFAAGVTNAGQSVNLTYHTIGGRGT